MSDPDAVVVGGGPNGLAGAIAVARSGRRVRLYEAHEMVGGGCRSDHPFGPDVTIDHCAAVHPLGRSSPFFRGLALERHGLEWLEPEIQVGHPFDDGTAALVSRSIDRTLGSLGSATDARRYASWMRPVVSRWDPVVHALLGPIRPRAILAGIEGALLVGPAALLPASWLARIFAGARARALLAGCAAHSFLPLGSPISASFGLLLLASAHAVGWPIPRGGAGRVVDALAAVLAEAGGRIETGHWVESLDELPGSGVQLLDLAPRGVLRLAEDRFPGDYARQLRSFRHGPAAFKVDYLLRRPIPWRAVGLASAGTVHLGGTLEEIETSEAAIAGGRVHERPFVVLTQPTQQDPTRAPSGRHVAWAYCHVPNGWEGDARDLIAGQIERFAPGFLDAVVDVRVTAPADFERYDANFVGGDINGGLMDWRQTFTRPALRLDPYSTPDPAIFICSSSTPPGGGVHGLCGAFSARSAMRRLQRD